MRTLISFLFGVLTLATAIAFGILATQNGQSASYSFMGSTLQGPVGWITAGAAALGFVVAFLLLIPGRLASAGRSWGLSQRAQALERRLTALRQEHAELQERHQRLQGSHERLLVEHNHVLHQVLPTPAAAQEQQPAAAATVIAERPHPTAPILPPHSPRRVEEKLSSGQQHQAPFADRVRERFRGLREQAQAKARQLRQRTDDAA